MINTVHLKKGHNSVYNITCNELTETLYSLLDKFDELGCSDEPEYELCSAYKKLADSTLTLADGAISQLNCTINALEQLRKRNE